MSNMFAACTDTEAAAITQQAAESTTKKNVIIDSFVKGTPFIKLTNGSHWLRFVTAYGLPWYKRVSIYDLSTEAEVCRYVAPSCIGGKDAVLAARIALYKDPTTASLMRRKTTDLNVISAREDAGCGKDGFSFPERSRALLIASEMVDANLSPFGILSVSVARPSNRPDDKPKPAWGDGLLRIPTIIDDDPTTGGSGGYKFGAIFDIERGRLIKADVESAGKMEMNVTWVPSENQFALGSFDGGGFQPKPQFAEILTKVPNIEMAINRPSWDEQVAVLEKFIPGSLWAVAIRGIEAQAGRKTAVQGATLPASKPSAPTQADDTLDGPRIAKTVPVPGKTPTFKEPAKAPFVVPIPQDDPVSIDPIETIFLNCCVILKARLGVLGVDKLRAAIKRGYITQGNHVQMCSLPDEVLTPLLANA